MLKSILKEICVKNKRAYVTNKFSMKIGYKNRALDIFSVPDNQYGYFSVVLPKQM